MADTAEAVNERLNEENLKLAEVLQENELLKQRVTALEARKDWTEEALTKLMSKHWAGTWNALVLGNRPQLREFLTAWLIDNFVRLNFMPAAKGALVRPSDEATFMME